MRAGECTVGCGQCCKFLVLQVNPQYIEVDDVRRWIELHGIDLDVEVDFSTVESAIDEAEGAEVPLGFGRD